MTSFFGNLSTKPQAISPARKSLLPISASLSALSEKERNHARSASDRIFLKGYQKSRLPYENPKSIRTYELYWKKLKEKGAL